MSGRCLRHEARCSRAHSSVAATFDAHKSHMTTVVALDTDRMCYATEVARSAAERAAPQRQ